MEEVRECELPQTLDRTFALLEMSALDPATLRKNSPGKMKQIREPVVAPVRASTVSTAVREEDSSMQHSQENNARAL